MPKTQWDKLKLAFEEATTYVLQETACETTEQISNGYCDVWAAAVKRKAPFVEIRERHGHWFVVFDGVAYDADRTEDGFDPNL